MNNILKFWPVLVVGVGLIAGYVRLEASAQDSVRRIDRVEPTVEQIKEKVAKGEIQYGYINDKMTSIDNKIDKLTDLMIKLPK